jgi:hypothetical protein
MELPLDSEPRGLIDEPVDSDCEWVEGRDSDREGQDVDDDLEPVEGSKFHDQADAKWIVIRGSLRGHDDMSCGRPTPGRPIGCLWVGRLAGRIWCFQLILISNIVFNMEFTRRTSAEETEKR